MSYPALEEPTVTALLSKKHHAPVADRGLAARYAPIIQFDAREPFLPLVTGYTVFREDGPSPSFPRQIQLGKAAVAVEYAIWWDWDIQHLYELEHIWVYLNAEGQVIRGEASWHGGYHDMAVDGKLSLTGDRLTLFSEPGKHAFAPTPAWLEERVARKPTTYNRQAGRGGVLVTALFEGIIEAKTPQADRLVHTYLEKRAFEPALDFSQIYQGGAEALVPWPDLFEWIPGRVGWWVAELERTIPPSERRFLRIAHRGASSHAPPNTGAAIAKAAELEADMVELDVLLSRDGVPIVSHPGDVRRVVKAFCSEAEHTLSELKALDLGNGQTILTLEEAIGLCRDYELDLYLELKENGVIRPVVEAFQKYNLYGRALVGSFRPDWLADVKAIDPSITLSVLFSSIHIDAVALAQMVQAQYVHPAWERQAESPHQLLTPIWVDKVRAAGLGLICWHEERPAEIAALRQIGVDGICSDAPELLL